LAGERSQLVEKRAANRGRPTKGGDYSRKQQLLQLDFDVDTRRQIQLHQRIDRLVGRIDDVHQAQMGADFELVARSLVDVRRTQQSKRSMRVGSGTGPRTTAPVRLAVSTIS
jgi:hypothetical protein